MYPASQLATERALKIGRLCLLQMPTKRRAIGQQGTTLYAWTNDKALGDTDGDGKLNGAWHIAAPKA